MVTGGGCGVKRFFLFLMEQILENDDRSPGSSAWVEGLVLVWTQNRVVGRRSTGTVSFPLTASFFLVE